MDKVAKDLLNNHIGAKFIVSSYAIIAIEDFHYTSVMLTMQVFGSRGKLELQYFHHYATFIASLNMELQVKLTRSIGSPAIAFSLKIGFDTTVTNLFTHSTGMNLKKADSCVSLVLGDKGDTIRAYFLHHVGMKNVVVGEIRMRFSTKENTFSVGVSYTVDHLTLIKINLDNHGRFRAVVRREVRPKSLLIFFIELGAKAFLLNLTRRDWTRVLASSYLVSQLSNKLVFSSTT